MSTIRSDVSDGTAFPYPVRLDHDRSSGRFEAVVDVFPAAVDDLTVEANSRRLHLTIERDGERVERSLRAPEGYRFGDDRDAVYNNGVLTVSLEASRRGR